MQKVLITGGAGFIGSNLANELAEQGKNVKVVDNLSNGSKENLSEDVEFHNIDFSSQETKNILKNCDTVFHLAATISVSYSNKNPLETHDNNLTKTLELLEYARQTGIESFVFASSAAVYGDNGRDTQKEDNPKVPGSIYGSTKLAAERYLQNYRQNYGLNTSIARLFNVYGPKQSFEGQNTPVIPLFLRKALRGEDLTVYGDGGQTRDFVYIDDVVSALIKAAKEKPAKPVNIGTGTSVTIAQLAEQIMSITDQEVDVKFKKHKETGIRHSKADIGCARQQINYKTEISLEEGLKETKDWIKQQLSQ